ncbi:HAD family hydrolase [Luteimicrobium album]|uniref:HAD family hydrolase n=1 Tax=Luteimicrobium album TaxID=1054550 RepID=UPI0032AF5972
MARGRDHGPPGGRAVRAARVRAGDPRRRAQPRAHAGGLPRPRGPARPRGRHLRHRLDRLDGHRAPGRHQGHGARGVRRRLGVEPWATVAIGDGRNDLGMLEWAARGVAMGHADDVVKAAADEVTGTIDEDGAAAVLRSLLT